MRLAAFPETSERLQDLRTKTVGDDWADTVVVRTRSLPARLRRSGRELFAAFAGGCACDFILVALGLILGYLVG